MFQWICNSCGRVLDVSVSECPQCAGRPSQQPLPGGRRVRVRVTGTRRWTVMGGILALLAVIVYLALPSVLASLRQLRARPVPAAAPTTPQLVLLPPERAEPLRGTVEVSGVRIYTDRAARARVMALVTNHSREVLENLSCRVDLRQAGSRDRTALASFLFELRGTLAPHAFREVQAPLELAVPLRDVPEWQELRIHLESCNKQ